MHTRTAAKKKTKKAIARDSGCGRPAAVVSNDVAEQDPADESKCEPNCDSAGPNDCGSGFLKPTVSSNAEEYCLSCDTDIAIIGRSVGLADASTACESDGLACTADNAWAEESHRSDPSGSFLPSDGVTLLITRPSNFAKTALKQAKNLLTWTTASLLCWRDVGDGRRPA